MHTFRHAFLADGQSGPIDGTRKQEKKTPAMLADTINIGNRKGRHINRRIMRKRLT
jgi:hypothetical protein